MKLKGCTVNAPRDLIELFETKIAIQTNCRLPYAGGYENRMRDIKYPGRTVSRVVKKDLPLAVNTILGWPTCNSDTCRIIIRAMELTKTLIFCVSLGYVCQYITNCILTHPDRLQYVKNSLQRWKVARLTQRRPTRPRGEIHSYQQWSSTAWYLL